MRVAVLGATGFIGYDFTRSLLDDPDVDVTVFASSASNLSNMSRHDVPVRLVGYGDMERDGLDASFDLIVNFAHPFQQREAMSQDKQISILAGALTKALKENGDLRLIHISTMSVYEPFAPDTRFPETHKPSPPKSDGYASSKAKFDEILLQDESLSERIMLPRPTIVYGPFCRPWTDGMLASFMSGDVLYSSLDGRMQPLYVKDLSRFLRRAMQDFKPGPLNVAGLEETPWIEFFTFFQDIVGDGRLRRYDGPVPKSNDRTMMGDIKTVIDTLIAEPAFTRLAKPVSKFIPKRTRVRVEAEARQNLSKETKGAASGGLPFVKPFFGEDRLVSTELFSKHYPEFGFTSLTETRTTLSRYMEFRFTDAPFGAN